MSRFDAVTNFTPPSSPAPSGPKDIVRLGYDRASYEYRGPRQSVPIPDYDAWLDDLVPRLPRPACVLDLGCGCGLPVAKRLVRTFDVTGIDISQVQIQRARILVQRAKFILGDMTAVDFPEGCFEAIVALYSLIHVPVEQQEALFGRMRRWLRPGGYLLATVGNTEWTGTESDWLGIKGVTMYWSQADEDTYLGWLAKLGFETLWTKFIPEGDRGHTLILARVPGDPAGAPSGTGETP